MLKEKVLVDLASHASIAYRLTFVWKIEPTCTIHGYLLIFR